jgi:O-antigen/teichoic acid export membrane protein
MSATEQSQTTGGYQDRGYRRIIAHSSIYMLGILLSKAVTFIMIPIYTSYLAPSDYGIIELLLMTVDILAFFIGIGLSNSIMRFYYDFDNEADRHRVISTGLIAGVTISAAGFGLLMLADSFAARLVLGSTEYAHFFSILFFGMMFSAGIEIPLVSLRAQQKSLMFVAVNLARLVLQLGLNIYFVVILHKGVIGVLYATVISTILISLYLMSRTLIETGIHFSFRVLFMLLRFGYPLILDNIGAFIITYSDRYFLKEYTNLNEVGLYALAYKFGMMVMLLIIAPFLQYWSAEMFATARREGAEKIFRDIFTYANLLAICFCFALCVFIRDIIQIMTREAYWPAYQLVPLICLAYIFAGMYNFASAGIMIAKKTKLMALTTVTAMVISLALNFTLVSKWGAYGAAIAVTAAYFVRFILANYFSQKLFPISYEWRRLLSVFVLAIVLVVAAMSITLTNLIAELMCKTAIVISLPVILYVTRWFNPREKEIVKTAVVHPSRMVKMALEIVRKAK